MIDLTTGSIVANFMPAVRYRWHCRGAIYLSHNFHEPFLFIAQPFQVCFVITLSVWGKLVVPLQCLIHTCDIFFLHGRGISSLKSYYLLSYREVYFLVVMTNITWSNCTEADQAYSLFFVDAFEAEK